MRRLILSLMVLHAALFIVRGPKQLPDQQAVNSKNIQAIYGNSFYPQRYVPTQRNLAIRQYTIRRQGNDSNYDYIAVYNGIQNIGGNGQHAYDRSRALVAQRPRDYKEAFYTLRGPNGSDLPFSINNLGAAPEAFVGVYESLGYNSVMLTTTPGSVSLDFARAIRDRLAEQPEQSFAHLWITPRSYTVPRRLRIAETGETVDLIYPYHEVAAMLAPGQPDRLVILDGLIGYPFTLPLETIANQLRGFNRTIVVRTGSASLEDHQRLQAAQHDRPYVVPTLGGAYLYKARQVWGPAYQTWGRVIGQPFRVDAGGDRKVVLPGEYVHYERLNANEVTLQLLGTRMGYELEQVGILPPNTIQPWNDRQLPNGIQDWVIQQFGSVERFTAVFGKSLTGEIWIDQVQMQQHVLRGVYFPPVSEGHQAGYVAVLTERAMLIWDAEHGVTMIPLGRIYYQ